MRLELLAGGGIWRLVRSARGGMAAVHRSGVPLRTSAGRRWKPPALADWEEPVEDPSRPHPSHPLVTAARREARRQQRAAKRVRLAALEAPTAAAPVPSPQPATDDAA